MHILGWNPVLKQIVFLTIYRIAQESSIVGFH